MRECQSRESVSSGFRVKRSYELARVKMLNLETDLSMAGIA